MTKMYMKKDCEFKNNRIVCGNEIVAIDKVVFDLLDTVEDTLQQAKYILNQPAPQDAPTLKGFERQHTKAVPRIVEPIQPFTDMKVMAAMHLMAEADAKQGADDINEALRELEPVFDFVNSDYIVEAPNGVVDAFDLSELGNPLELTEDTLVSAVITMKNADLHQVGEEGFVNHGKVENQEEANAKVCDLMAKDFAEFLENLNVDQDGDEAATFEPATEEPKTKEDMIKDSLSEFCRMGYEDDKKIKETEEE